jgi:hypothetical protein
MLRAARPNTNFDRSSVLERSFACAFDEAFGAPRDHFACPSAAGSGGVRQPFASLWFPTDRVPALILNTTWVETGFRAAFAPFPLYKAGDGTLYSFEEDFRSRGVPIAPSRSVIEAAFVSARFPGIVPAWPLEVEPRRPLESEGDRATLESEQHWSFVDGGYVDNSGSSTALDVYRALQKYIQDPKIELILVMLTDANTDLPLSEVKPNFSDLVAPITALLRVRDQLAGRAVKRAIEELEPNATGDDLVGRGKKVRVLKVNLIQKTFELPLGWKMSKTTQDIVQLMLGSPELCPKENEGAQPPQKAASGRPEEDVADAIRVITNNSCVKKRIIGLLGD